MRAAAAAPALLITAALLAGAAPTAPAAAAPAPAPATITLNGQDITASLVADLAYFYRHAVDGAPRFALTTGGTSAGMADTARGIADGGMVSRALAAGDPPGLVLTRLARSGVCLISNRANPVASISRAQLQDLVAGRVTGWSGFAGSTRTDAITPVVLAPTTGAGRVFQTVFVDDATPVAWQPVTLISSTQARDYVEQTPSGFGYADLALTGPVHAIAYEGVGCTRQTIRDGTYPASRPLGIVTRGQPRGALARFLRWVRSSPTARRVIATRYVPG
jgi:phosphate transport system substrate-binding protein